MWCPEPKVLKKLRKAIVDNIDEFKAIVETPEVMETFPLWYGRKLKTAPKGYDRDHPDIEYLRLTEYGKCCYLSRDFFEKNDWHEQVADRLSLLKPLNDFLNYSIDE